MNYSKEIPYLASIQSRYLLNKQGSSKKTHHIELFIEQGSLEYVAGDSIGIYPENDPQIVQHILNSCDLTGDEMFENPKRHIHMTTKDFLTKKANLAKFTSKLLTNLFEQTNSQKLSEILNPENKTVLFDVLHNYEVWDLFQEFISCPINYKQLFLHILPLLPRFYSIASSSNVFPEQIDLTVSELEYTTRNHIRYGVGSRFLCHLAKINTPMIPIFVHPSNGFTLPLDPDANIIMIGPGTGIAPFRAFLQERQSIQAKGLNWLFFGERNQSYDFYYENYFRELERKNQLRLTTAFSRDQEGKIYVQDRLLEHGKEVWEWMEKNTYLYICGDAKEMSKGVDLALRKIVKLHGKMSEEKAIQHIKQWKKDKKLLLDVY